MDIPKPKFDLFGKPIPVIPKCKHCGYSKGTHKANTLHCPLGKLRHSRYGHCHFQKDQVYEPRATRKKRTKTTL